MPLSRHTKKKRQQVSSSQKQKFSIQPTHTHGHIHTSKKMIYPFSTKLCFEDKLLFILPRTRTFLSQALPTKPAQKLIVKRKYMPPSNILHPDFAAMAPAHVHDRLRSDTITMLEQPPTDIPTYTHTFIVLAHWAFQSCTYTQARRLTNKCTKCLGTACYRAKRLLLHPGRCWHRHCT